MDFQSILNQYKPLLRKHWIPLVLGCIGLIFFIYGLIVLLAGSGGSEEVIFESANQDVKGEESREKIVIDVAGAVVSPGVYKLATDARVQDALVAAGGLSAQADREWVAKALNLAAKVQDGGKIYIPTFGEGEKGDTGAIGSMGNVGDVSKQININTASQARLESLPGIGPVTAGKIIDGRPYSSTEELLSRKIVGKSVWEKIKEKISIY